MFYMGYLDTNQKDVAPYIVTINFKDIVNIIYSLKA